MKIFLVLRVSRVINGDKTSTLGCSYVELGVWEICKILSEVFIGPINPVPLPHTPMAWC